jgi:two-component system sensor histidine kinase AlgZ
MSINQNVHDSALPDFRNLGILLRILLIVDGMCLVAAMLESGEPLAVMTRLTDTSALVQPILLLSLLLLAAVSDLLRQMRYRHALAALIAIEFAVSTMVFLLWSATFDAFALARCWMFTLLVTGVLIGYFDLRSRALSPALTEARLQALQARIRPHFLFNSINAVLSLIRQDPRRAEQVIEDLADLFRVLMADNRKLTPIAREVDLAKQYLNIELLRLGARLQVEWDIAGMPADALIPPLVLQPLLENAVYHGIEPRSAPGKVVIRIHLDGERVHVRLSNPFQPAGGHHSGNRMALANIRERLALHFDAEASIKTTVTSDTYEVHIVIPYVRNSS